jgi:two-component system phosphate regulon response regulator PhoB
MVDEAIFAQRIHKRSTCQATSRHRSEPAPKPVAAAAVSREGLTTLPGRCLREDADRAAGVTTEPQSSTLDAPWRRRCCRAALVPEEQRAICRVRSRRGESDVVYVLVADDVAPLRMVVRRALKADGHHVVEVADGDAALEHLHEHLPDVAILDVNMPGHDGLALCRIMRADHHLREVAIIVVSGNAAAAPALEAGADAFLKKPFRPAELQDTVARLVM